MTSSSSAAGIVLAAGKGTRMKSDLPKVLHRICGLPLAEWVGRAMIGAGISKPVMVVGFGGEQLQDALGDKYEYVWQRDQLGTGHAALQAAELMAGCKGPVVITPGDTPLISAEVLSQLLSHHRETSALCTVATAFLEDPTGYGRILRDGTGAINRIVEQKDASSDEQTIKEVNSGIYVFDGTALFEILPSLGNENSQGEYYLTDALEAAGKRGRVESVAFVDPGLLLGVNDRWQLAQADKIMRHRILKRHALSGVSLQDPDTIYIEADVEVGPDCAICANTHLRGTTKIGGKCRIGPNSLLDDCSTGDDCAVLMSHLYQAKLGNKVKVGPFANLRPGTVLGDNCKVGNFVEIKNAQLGQFVAASHLTYIGDASVGDETNIGAGTITCNYDGYEKNRTTIGARVFVGSNSTIIAPRTIEDDAFVAAGSTIDRDVPAFALGVGRAKQEVKEGWVQRWRNRKGSSSEKQGKKE